MIQKLRMFFSIIFHFYFLLFNFDYGRMAVIRTYPSPTSTDSTRAEENSGISLDNKPFRLPDILFAYLDGNVIFPTSNSLTSQTSLFSDALGIKTAFELEGKN